MKKLKSTFCTALLSICLIGNALAGGGGTTMTSPENGFFSFFADTIDAIVSLFREGGGDCPPRRCGNCKPGQSNDPHCRPTE